MINFCVNAFFGTYFEELVEGIDSKRVGSAFLYTACWLHKQIDLNNMLHSEA